MARRPAAAAWPWHAAPTPCPTPRSSSTSTSGIPFGVLELDDSVLHEIEDALRIAERSGDDLALAFASGGRWALRWCTATRLRNVTVDRSCWPRSANMSCAGDTTCATYRSSMCTWRGRGLGEEIAMRRYRSCAPPPTISFRDGQLLPWGIPATGVLVETLLDRGPTVTWPKPRPRSTRLAGAPADDGLVIRDIWLLRLRACWHRPEATRPATATIGIATGRWPPTWALRAICSGPRRCRDAGAPLGGGHVPVHRHRGFDPAVGGRPGGDAGRPGRPRRRAPHGDRGARGPVVQAHRRRGVRRVHLTQGGRGCCGRRPAGTGIAGADGDFDRGGRAARGRTTSGRCSTGRPG